MNRLRHLKIKPYLGIAALAIFCFYQFRSYTIISNEINIVQEEIDAQRQSISTVVSILQEEREERKRVERQRDTLQAAAQYTRLELDSLITEKQKAMQAKRQAEIKIKRLEHVIKNPLLYRSPEYYQRAAPIDSLVPTKPGGYR